MYIDVESLRFTPAGETEASLAASPVQNGAFVARYEGGAKRIECMFSNGMLAGKMNASAQAW